MRLDKFLKVSRLIKRRTVANEACDAGRVFLNEKPAKASAAVKELQEYPMCSLLMSGKSFWRREWEC